MDAGSKVDFINSVAAGRKIPCPACNSLNDSDAVFCFSCGSKLAPSDSPSRNNGTIICPACSEPNETDAAFCASCGAKLTAGENGTSNQMFESIGGTADEAEKKREASSPAVFTVKHSGADATVRAKSDKTQVRRKPVQSQVFQAAVTAEAGEPEEISVFARGLPSWDVVPPQVTVRRKIKR